MTVKFNDGREITAIEVVLNEISMIYEEAYRDKSNEIFDALYNIGYYDGL